MFEFVGVEPEKLALGAEVEVEVMAAIGGNRHFCHSVAAGGALDAVLRIGLIGSLPKRPHQLRRYGFSDHGQADRPASAVFALEEEPTRRCGTEQSLIAPGAGEHRFASWPRELSSGVLFVL